MEMSIIDFDYFKKSVFPPRFRPPLHLQNHVFEGRAGTHVQEIVLIQDHTNKSLE